MPATLNVLLLEDSSDDAELITSELRMAGFDLYCRHVETERDYLAGLDAAVDVILADCHLPRFSATAALSLLLQRGLDIPFIVVTGAIGDEEAVAFMRQGAADYLLKDRLGRLGEAVRNAVEMRHLRTMKRTAEEALQASEAALRRSETRYRHFSELTSDYCYALDVHRDWSTTLTWATDSFIQLTGLVTGDLVTTDDWAGFVHPDDLPVFQNQRQAMRIGWADPVEFRVVTAGGDVRLLRHHMRAEWDRPHTWITRIYGAAQDITVSRQADERIRFQAHLLEMVGEAVIATDPSEVITYWNHAAETLYGWAAAEVLGQRIRSVLPTEPLDARDADTPSALGEGDRLAREYVVRDRSGRAFPIQVSATPVLDEIGAVIGIIGVSSEISARVRASEILRESEARYRLVVETAGEGIWQIDQDSILVFVNPAMAAMLGYTMDEMLGASTAMFVVDLDTPTRAATVRARKAGSTELFEVPFRHKNGSQLWLLASGRALREADGAYVGILTMFTDITARKEAEAQLIAERDLLRTLMDAVPDAVYVKDEQSRFLRVNVAQARYLGAASPEEVVGKTDLDYYPPELAERLFAQERRLLATGDPLINDLEDQSSRGQGRRWILSSKVPLRQADQITGLVGISRDITAMKQSEEERERFFTLTLDMLCVVSVDGYFKNINPAFERTLGFTTEELCAEPFLHFVHPDDQEATLAETVKLANGITTTSFENRYRCKDGTYRRLLWNVVPVPTDRLLYATARDITERKQAEDQRRRHLNSLSALRTIDMAIIGSMDLQLTLAVILEQVARTLGVDASLVLTLNPQIFVLEYAAARGFRGSAVHGLRLQLGEGHAGRAALERRLISVPNLARDPLGQAVRYAGEDFVSYWAVPLVVKGEVKGVLALLHRSSLAVDQEWLDFLGALAGQTAIAIDNAQLFSGLQRSTTELSVAYDATIEGWARALDLRDNETEGHSRRVTALTLTLARAMGMGDDRLVQVRRGALLHDIGKMGIPDAILLKPGALTDEEWVVMRKHPTFAYELLLPIAYLRTSLDIPYRHHEKWDGTGYPNGLVGERIPQAARIFAVVDVWDALRSDRPYRKAWPVEKVREHIRGLAGSHFDPDVVETFLALDVR